MINISTECISKIHACGRRQVHCLAGNFLGAAVGRRIVSRGSVPTAPSARAEGVGRVRTTQRPGGRRRPRLAPRPARPTPSAPVPRASGHGSEVCECTCEPTADPSQRLAAASPPAASAGPSARRTDTEFASVRGRRRISHSHGVRPTHTPTASEANAECRRTVVCGRRPLHLVFNGLSGEKPFASFFAPILFVREYKSLIVRCRAALLPFVRTRARARPGTAPALSLLRAAGRSDAFKRPKGILGRRRPDFL